MYLVEPDNNDMPALINFLKTNGYELEDVKYNPRRGGSAQAIFTKMTHIAELDGNDINDATINIEIDFDTRFDYKNGVFDEEEGYVYDFSLDKARAFIEKLIDGNYEDATGNGKRKRKGKGKRIGTRKTRKNRKR